MVTSVCVCVCMPERRPGYGMLVSTEQNQVGANLMTHFLSGYRSVSQGANRQCRLHEFTINVFLFIVYEVKGHRQSVFFLAVYCYLEKLPTPP